jgi:TatA/E family protein of Tat protein translocase
MGIENPVHLLFIALVALIVLGPRRLPELARALGKGVREFREAISQESHEAEPPAANVPSAGHALLTAPAPVIPPAPATRPAPEPGVQEPSVQEPSVQEPVTGPARVAGAPQVDPAQAVRSGDAPDRGPL